MMRYSVTPAATVLVCLLAALPGCESNGGGSASVHAGYYGGYYGGYYPGYWDDDDVVVVDREDRPDRENSPDRATTLPSERPESRPASNPRPASTMSRPAARPMPRGRR
jgi:hypothetical protein